MSSFDDDDDVDNRDIVIIDVPDHDGVYDRDFDRDHDRGMILGHKFIWYINFIKAYKFKFCLYQKISLSRHRSNSKVYSKVKQI